MINIANWPQNTILIMKAPIVGFYIGCRFLGCRV